jgi:hypothetical protein
MKKTQKTQLSLTAINKDLTFSKKSVWLWVKLPPTPYEFLDYGQREELVAAATIGYTGILVADDKSIECELIKTTEPFNEIEWADQLFEQAKNSNPSSYLPEFLGRMEQKVYQNGFQDRKVYLGIKIGFRNEYNNTSSALPFQEIFNAILPRLDLEDYEISEKELSFWTDKAKNFKRTLLNGNLNAEEVTATELAYLTKRPFFPNMSVPEVNISKKEAWGRGELDFLVDGQIENHPKFIKITQEVDGKTVEGYRTVLCFARFPDEYAFPDNEPWIHFSSSLPFATDFYSRFTIEPARKVRKEINKKIAEIKDQAVNMTSAGGNLNMDILDRHDQAISVEYDLSKNRTPWLYGKHRIIIEAGSEEILKDRVQKTIDHYKNLDIQLIQPTGDQLSLFLEGMPNDYSRTNAFIQRQDLAAIPAGLPTGSGSAGDKIKLDPNGQELGFIGPYIGYTTSRVVSPVFFAPHASIATGNAPGCLITGSPGSGKSFLAFTITYLLSLMGVWTIYIDPKGDAIPMAQLPGIKERTRVLDLKNGQEGMLDPFSLGTDLSKQKELALEVIMLFMGGEDRITSTQRVQIVTAITTVASLPDPSLDMVAEYLLQSPDMDAQSVGHNLDLMRGLPFAKLCFSPRKIDNVSVENKLTIITLTGLDLPSNTSDMSRYSTSNKLAVAIMFLLTDYTSQLMFNTHQFHPKAIVIDEAWAVTGTPQGEKLVETVSRMGRSLNTVIVMVSQNAKDFLGAKVTNSASTKIAFRAKDPDEIDNILTLLGLDHDDSNRSYIRNLDVGEAIIKDAHDRLARIRIDAWDTGMITKFETNPEKKRRQAEEEKRAALMGY